MNDEKINILIIDDNKGDVRLIEEKIRDLRNNSFNIIHAVTLSEGIDLYGKMKFDIILLDLSLPNSIGQKTISKMLKEVSNVPVIILTGTDDELLAIEAVRSGAQDYLVKGKINSIILERSIQYAIERHRNNTRLKEVTNKLQVSEAKLNALFENAPFAILLHDIDGNIQKANNESENLFVYKAEEIMLQNIYNLLEEQDSIKFRKKISNSSEKNMSIDRFEATIKNRLNASIDVEIASVYLKFEKKSLIETYFIDISDRINYEKNRKFLIDQLLNSLEAKSTFFASMSHDFRTPLNAIIGFSDLLLEGNFGRLRAEQVDFLKDIRNSADDLLRILVNILDFSEIESGIFKLTKVSFNLLPIINDLINILRPKYKEKGLIFYLEGIDENTKINADLLKFKQILYNLFENAIKFTDTGKFTFKGLERTDHWEFQVSDTGEGIAVEDYEIVFREFERIDNYIKKSVPGTGLGLALTKRLILLHKGEIWFESKEGAGTTFYFTIPKAMPSSQIN